MVDGNRLIQNNFDTATMDTVIFAMWWLWVVGLDVSLFNRPGRDTSGIKYTRGGQDYLVTSGRGGCN